MEQKRVKKERPPELKGVTCPSCGSANVSFRAGSAVLGAVSWTSYICQDCRHTFGRHQVSRTTEEERHK